METQARYVLVGAFALAGFVGLVGFLLWFAQFELDRQFAYYDVRFTSVSGLSRASEVRFSGLPVGQVVEVRLSPNGDGTVLARLEVVGDTPVRTDSVATIESMGVTGVSFVGITAGDPASALLRSEDGIPEITAGRSVLQSLTEDAPEIVAEALSVMQRISDILNEENQQKVQGILDNLEKSSGDLSGALDDFAVVSRTIASASVDIAGFTAQIEPVIGAIEGTLSNMDTTLTSFRELTTRATSSLEVVDAALSSGRVALDAAEGFMTGDLPVIVQDMTATTLVLREQTELLVTDARGMVTEFTAAGSAATARLTEAQRTLEDVDTTIARLLETLDNIDEAATSFDDLISNDGTALMAETRDMVANADAAVNAITMAAETDLPAIVADIRSATDTANRVVADVGQQISDAAGRIDGLADNASETMTQITGTFANANETLAAINSALSTGERTLDAAERAFAGADRVINEDFGAVTSDLRKVMQRLEGAIAQVSDDIPAITGDLRRAAETANTTFAQLGQIVSSSSAPITAFAATGLPQYTQLARETRNLISNLEKLTRQIERDPARFFLNRQSPEFRR
jgi:phospholipid/cholesterol/gamma-HCH transport system substrate-binding protein